MDLLVLDEAESIWEQVTSPLVKNRNALRNFFWAVRYAKRVVALDANLGERTRDLLANHLRPTIPLQWHTNDFKNGSGSVLYTTTNDAVATTELVKLVRAGKKIVVPTNSKMIAQSLQQLLLSEGGLSTDEVHCYTADTDDSEKEEHFADVKTFWSRYRVVIFSPTVTAGCSFEADHFDLVFGFFTNTSTTVETARQMMHRVRILRDKAYYVCFRNCGTNNVPSDLNSLEDALATRAKHVLAPRQLSETWLAGEISRDGRRLEFRHKDPYYWVYVWNWRQILLSSNDFAGRFIEQERRTGLAVMPWAAEISPEQVDAAAKLSKEARERVAEIEALAVSTARSISDDDAHHTIDKQESMQPLTRDEKLSLKKWQLKQTYRLASDGLVTAQFVRDYADQHVQSVFKTRLRLAEAAAQNETTDQYLTKLQCDERNVYSWAAESADILGRRENLRYEHLRHAFLVLEAAGFGNNQLLCGAASMRLEGHILLQRLRAHLHALGQQEWMSLRTLFKRKKMSSTPPAVLPLKTALEFVNSVLRPTLGLTIALETRRGSIYRLNDTCANLFNGDGQPQIAWTIT